MRSEETPVAAKYEPIVACRPDVEKFGLVLPRRNAPHSACPYFPQPDGSRASESRSPKPSGLRGQPSASAIGFGIARTSGVCAMLGRSLGRSPGTRSALSCAAVRWRSSTAHDVLAGLHTSGRGPSIASSQPLASASVAPPDALETTFTCTQWPPASWSPLLYESAIVVTSAAFSLEATIVSSVQPDLPCCTVSGFGSPPVSHERTATMRTSPTTTATTIGALLRDSGTVRTILAG